MPSADAENDKCNDILTLGDDYGDNECTFLCMLEAGHDGPHRDEFRLEGKSVIVTWHTKEGNNV